MKRLFQSVVMLLVPVFALAQNPQRSSYAVMNNTGYLQVIPNASISLCQYNSGLQCNVTVGIYSDPALTQPIGYPFYANVNGYFSYYTNPGNYIEQQCIPGGGCFTLQLSFGGGSGSGSVVSFSAGAATPLFTTAVANPTTTPALIFSVSNAAQNSVLAGPVSGGPNLPSYQTAPTFNGSNLTNLPFMSLTTTGSSGAATLTSGVLNVPIYAFTNPISGQTTGYAIEAATATTVTGPFPLDDAITTANTITAHKLLAVNDGTGNAGRAALQQGTLPPNITNNVTLIAPSSVTAYRIELPGVEPTSGNTFFSCTAADPAVCSWTSDLISTGTKFTASGCSNSATVGGAVAGQFDSGTSGTCTVIVTMNGATGLAAPNGWACHAVDLTTEADLITQTASSATTATLSGTTVSGDVINFACTGY